MIFDTDTYTVFRSKQSADPHINKERQYQGEIGKVMQHTKFLRCYLKFMKQRKYESNVMQIRESFPQVILTKAGIQPEG